MFVVRLVGRGMSLLGEFLCKSAKRSEWILKEITPLR